MIGTMIVLNSSKFVTTVFYILSNFMFYITEATFKLVFIHPNKDDSTLNIYL